MRHCYSSPHLTYNFKTNTKNCEGSHSVSLCAFISTVLNSIRLMGQWVNGSRVTSQMGLGQMGHKN